MENIKKSYKNNKFRTSAPTWHEACKLPDESYSISDIQDYFDYTFKKHRKKIINSSIRIYINKIENGTTFKIKTRYYLELLTPETIKLFGSSKSKITKDENGENVLYLEITELILMHCNVANKA